MRLKTEGNDKKKMKVDDVNAANSSLLFDKKAFKISEKLFTDIAEYIDDNYVDEHSDEIRGYNQVNDYNMDVQYDDFPSRQFVSTVKKSDIKKKKAFEIAYISEEELSLNLENLIDQIDESFSQMLLRKIDEKGMKDSECYKKANIDRKLFSKIRSDIHYRPSKTTVIAFAIALELSLDETKDMLMKSGFALSRSNKFDIIIEYFISKSNYNIFEINEALFAFDQTVLGA